MTPRAQKNTAILASTEVVNGAAQIKGVYPRRRRPYSQLLILTASSYSKLLHAHSFFILTPVIFTPFFILPPSYKKAAVNSNVHPNCRFYDARHQVRSSIFSSVKPSPEQLHVPTYLLQFQLTLSSREQTTEMPSTVDEAALSTRNNFKYGVRVFEQHRL